jgi:hypothetical protein
MTTCLWLCLRLSHWRRDANGRNVFFQLALRVLFWDVKIHQRLMWFQCSYVVIIIPWVSEWVSDVLLLVSLSVSEWVSDDDLATIYIREFPSSFWFILSTCCIAANDTILIRLFLFKKNLKLFWMDMIWYDGCFL